MPKNPSIRKTMVIGSGPIVIGQAAEFDYAGTQACRALREEGVEIVLVNSNPATIMTDPAMADRVYIEPMDAATVKRIIEKERPDSLLPTLGGQTGLNLAMELHEDGFLEKKGVKLIGTSAAAIFKAEDREAFRDTMTKIGEPVVDNVIVHTVEDAVAFANRIGYPVIVRPAYTLGGTGGGMANDEEELREVCQGGLKSSRVHQCLIERSIAGWKEIEFEVIRDSADNALSICNMENIDPVGIHTGDSIVVAPCKSLTDEQLSMLRDSAIKIIRELGIEGGCNVQFALKPDSMEYYLIEVNPRLSRSSALASKATSYPIARVATKIALGYRLDEILLGRNKAHALFEPQVNYTVLKMPRWPFDKFTAADKHIGTKMKATGEVMAIGETFEAAFLKALRSLELNAYSLRSPRLTALSDGEVANMLRYQGDERIFFVFESIRRGVKLSEIYDATKIDWWFLERMKGMCDMEAAIERAGADGLTKELMQNAKIHGVSDAAIAKLTGITEGEVRAKRKALGVLPHYKVVDTCPHSPGGLGEYLYSVYGQEGEKAKRRKETAVVLGSGPIRIGQGVEFDYCCVHCAWALKKQGFHTIMINNNPETVSTDYDTADTLYFEPLTPEEVYNILERENPAGVVVQFGGQTAIKLAKPVVDAGYKLFGTDLADIDAAEDRERFDELLEEVGLKRPKGFTVFTKEEALKVAEELGYPVLVRPSYVLGGQGMTLAYNEQGVSDFMDVICREKQEHPVLIDKYLRGKEVEVDAVSDGYDLLIPGIMEHVERAGIHSGDSISVYPAKDISGKVKSKLIEATKKLADALHVKGLVNIQYILHNDDVYVIEVNPRSSRTVPFISKVTGIPLPEVATRAMLGERIAGMGFGTGLAPDARCVAVKVPVFSLDKLPDVEVTLGPEMKSTGEVLGLGRTLSEALYKGLCAAGLTLPDAGAVVFSVADNDKNEMVDLAIDLSVLGYDIYATSGTANVLNQSFVGASVVTKEAGSLSAEQLIEEGRAVLVVNTPTHGRERRRFGFRLRRLATERSIPCLTSADTVRALVQALKARKSLVQTELIALQDV
ncbi:MAG: carbamoyl-phosphate synthase large subunit [Christensenellales bacterium]|jgi:carbamoyl-phosphate synthase large subunit